MKVSSEKVIEIFRSFLRKKGLRFTPEREAIINQIYADESHFDVDEIYLKLRQRQLKISKASIYRLIPLLLECKLIRGSFTEDGHQHYEHLYGHNHHDHLRCLGCGKIIEFMDKTIEKTQEKVGVQYGFTIIDHSMEIIGYCKRCAIKNKNENI
ncbi:MAG: hypothetical protein A2161_02690 [Candidatus Schekmanbacteria bacterium RBG_13_48_7]|uniref:Transcriptional repressor n=1 Tax=Candidatus Schekmanbacteria bacterium RBG_13_48_7 TaxID=1817878 RepID=A0A1F7S2T1_9BACT|nr:MAG: hypothetical protein A2161_02690 [Candidatus Schekmanbacteria bacterium RBG_13_48_7]